MKTKTLTRRIGHLNRGEAVRSYAMLSVSLIGTAMFVIFPLFWVLRYCLFQYNGYGATTYVGFYNFIRAFTNDAKFWNSVLNTFIFAFGKLLIEIPLALVLAYLLSRKMKGVSFFRSIYFLPSMLSVAIIGIQFFYLFAEYNGIVNNVLQQLTLITKPISWFGEKWHAMAVLAIASIWQNFGLNMIFFLTGMQSVPEELYESAAIDGANSKQRFFKITLPMLGPMMQMIIMNAVLGSLKVTDIVLTLTNGQPGGETEVMMTYIYKLFFNGGLTASDYGYASALVFITGIILGIMTFIYLRSTRKGSNIY